MRRRGTHLVFQPHFCCGLIHGIGSNLLTPWVFTSAIGMSLTSPFAHLWGDKECWFSEGTITKYQTTETYYSSEGAESPASVFWKGPFLLRPFCFLDDTLFCSQGELTTFMGSSATLAPSPSQALSPNAVTLVTGFQHVNWRHTHIQTQKGTFQVCVVKVFAEWWNSFSKAHIILIFWDFLVLVLVSRNLASDFRFAERKGKEGQLLSGIPLLFWVQPAMQKCPPKNSDSPSSEQNA